MLELDVAGTVLEEELDEEIGSDLIKDEETVLDCKLELDELAPLLMVDEGLEGLEDDPGLLLEDDTGELELLVGAVEDVEIVLNGRLDFDELAVEEDEATEEVEELEELDTCLIAKALSG